MLPVLCMKMWWNVVVIEDLDHDPEEATDLRHYATSPTHFSNAHQPLPINRG
jgi:hypothetical protein